LQQLIRRFRKYCDELAPLIQKIECFDVIYDPVGDQIPALYEIVDRSKQAFQIRIREVLNLQRGIGRRKPPDKCGHNQYAPCWGVDSERGQEISRLFKRYVPTVQNERRRIDAESRTP